MNTDILIAKWETKGKDFLHLFEYTSEKWGITFHYKGLRCGGGLPSEIKTRHDAIAWMDTRNGAAAVLRADRPSLKRVNLF